MDVCSIIYFDEARPIDATGGDSCYEKGYDQCGDKRERLCLKYCDKVSNQI